MPSSRSGPRLLLSPFALSALALALACTTPSRTATVVPPAAAQVPSAERVTPDVPEPAAAVRIAVLRSQAVPFVDAFLNTEAILTRDGKRVLFLSNRDGLPQVYVADASRPDSPARRLVERPERMRIASTTPDGRSLLFFSDSGADENWSLWKVDLAGGKPVELTPGETMQRDHAFVPDLAPSTAWFSGRRMSEASSAVFAVPADAPGPAREVYRDSKPGVLADVSRDGKRGAFVRYPSRSDNTLLALDLATGATRPLYPRSGLVSIFEARFSPDGRKLYVATDGGGEQAWLLALDAETGEERARFVETDPPVATIAALAVAKDGRTVAATVDAGDRNRIRLLDAQTLRPIAEVAMPLGQGSVQDFSEDGSRLTAVWSTPSSPTDAWVVEARTGNATPLRKEPRPALGALQPIETSLTKVRAQDGLELPVSVQLPKGRTGKLPVIVWYHGGPSASSRVRWSAIAAFFLSQGYAWVEPNVRGSGGFGRAFEEADNGPRRLDAFKDIETTGRWAASQPWADPDRVVVFGGSYGGYTVLIGLTRMPALWRAGVDLFGVADLQSFMATTSGFIRQVFLVEFGDPEKDAEFLATISPLRHVDQVVAPLFVYAGANDPRVPRSESDLIVRALRERKVPVEYMVAEDEGHSLARRGNLVEFLARSARFLEEYAGPRAPAAPR